MSTAKPKPLTETMRAVLRLAQQGEDLYSYCFNRSEHGARTSCLMAMRRRGLLKGFALTDAGRAALEADHAHR